MMDVTKSLAEIDASCAFPHCPKRRVENGDYCEQHQRDLARSEAITTRQLAAEAQESIASRIF